MNTFQTSSVRWAVLAAATALGGCVVAPLEHPRNRPPVYRSAPPVPQAVPQAAPQPVPLYFYPQRGQPEAVQDRDRFECYRWAVRETGVDPGMTAVRSDDPGRLPPPPPSPRPPPRRADAGDVVAGAATGAIIGAAVSSPRHAGAHAVLGALFGAVAGAASGEARNRAIDHAQARQDAAAAAQTQRAQLPLDNFRRAMTACMEGRAYRVQ